MMHKHIFGSIVGLVVASTAAAFGATSSFVVTVTPDTFIEGDAVDVEVRAVDSQGNVTTDFTSDIYMGIDEVGLITQDEYTLPSDGFYPFEPSDQGIKTFSKGLIIKKPGTYTLYIEDIYDTDVRGETTVIVTSAGGSSAGEATVVVSSPANKTVLDRTTTTVIGTSDSPRTPLSVELNGSVVETTVTTDETGGFSVPVDGLIEGENTLIVQLRDAEGELLGASEALVVTVALDAEALLQGFSMNPAEGLMTDDESTVTVMVADRVTSVSLMVDGAAYPLERAASDQYRGVISFQDPGAYELSLRLYVDGEMTEVDVDDVTVEGSATETTIDTTKDYAIGMIRYLTDPLSPGRVTVEREALDDVSPYYTIYYGINAESLDMHFTVDKTSAILSDLSLDETTYVQVWPSTETGAVLGEPSDPLVVSFQAAAPQCVVKGITLSSEQRGSDYYLVWDVVEGAESYTIYRADNETDSIADMTIVGTTTATEYQYPFDPDAEYEQYAYYAIQANCADGLNAQIDGVEKVSVGPVSSALMVLLLVVAIYFLYRVNVYREE